VRGPATRTALVTAIEAAALDDDAGGEQFTYVDLGGAEVSAMTERCFTLHRTSLDLTEVMTARVPTVTYLCAVYYGMYDNVGDRMHQDAERLVGALWSLHTTEADVCSVSLSAAEFDASEVIGMNVLAFEISIKYQLDSGV